MNVLLRGAVGGLVATGAMTVVMFAGKFTGLLQQLPPKKITLRASRKTKTRPFLRSKGTFDPAWLAAHLGYGMTSGVVYSLLRRFVPGSSILSGALFGTGLWAISYLKLLPELGLYPSSTKENPSQVGVMIAAHEVYGSVLGLLDDRLRPNEE